MKISDMRKIFYHVAPTELRQVIAADQGLWACESPDLSEEGVYLFDNLDDARRFQTAHVELGVTDIWSLTIDTDSYILEQDPLEPGGWMVPDQFVEPSEMQVI